MLAMPLVIEAEPVSGALETSPVTVVFDPNGGVGDFESIESWAGTSMMDLDYGYTFSNTYKIPSSYVPTRNGATFLGWCHEQDGSGTLFQPGESLAGTRFYDKVEDEYGSWWWPEPFMLYAIWHGPTYSTLEFLSDSLTDGSVRYGDSAELTVYEQGNEMQEGTQ